MLASLAFACALAAQPGDSGSEWVRVAGEYVELHRAYFVTGRRSIGDLTALTSAGERLARRVPPERTVREALSQSDPVYRAAALAVLSVAKSWSGDLVPRLIHMMRHERDPVMRGLAVDALRSAPGDAVRKNAEAIIQAFSDESDINVVVSESFLAMRLDPDAAIAAIATLSIRGDDTLRRVLHAQLRNTGGSAAVERASEKLERLGKTEAAAALMAIEKEQEERNRAERAGD